MTRNVCVITNATTADAYFPLWVKYYGKMFGQKNLFVVAYGSGDGFDQFELGGTWVVSKCFDDIMAAKLTSKFVDALLEVYDVVIRCDVDEFVVPNLNIHKSLRSYIDDLDKDYVTAIGVDVFQVPGDPDLNFETPILGRQRSRGALNSALDKTVLTSIPLEWGPGFHATKTPPIFDGLFLFHLKYADVNARINWHIFMANSVAPGSSEEKYFRDAQGHENGHIQFLRSLETSGDYFDQVSFADINRHKISDYVQKPSGLISPPFLTIFSVNIPPQYGAHL